MQIGPYQLESNLILAPMAGITDLPFRQLCRRYGAGMAVSEMVSANPALRNNRRTKLKADHSGESSPRSVQILGTEPRVMADAARFNADRGAQIIDINMGCPAKKVCSIAAGSALLRNEPLVGNILEAVVNAVDIPVTLKIRTGWDQTHRNAARIAKIAEQSGIQALSIHGRTRACGFSGSAEYDTIVDAKQQVKIPIIANGDIDSAEKAKFVLQKTGADAIMIGRAAQGRPWIFQQINYYLKNNKTLGNPDVAEVKTLLTEHMEALYGFYGDFMGVRIARKHIGWYLGKHYTLGATIMKKINRAETPRGQLAVVETVFDNTGPAL